MSLHLEGKLREPICNWLNEQGFTPVFEVGISGACDVVGAKFSPQIGRNVPPLEQIWAIELKLHDVAGVIHQARSRRWRAHRCFAAMPLARVVKFRAGTLMKFKAAGVGLLVVNEVGVSVAIEPAQNDVEIHRHFHRNLWRRRKEWRVRLIEMKAVTL